MEKARVIVIKPQAQVASQATQTPGMQRQELISSPDSWVGMVRMEPGLVSGWHHHGEYDSYIYLISGRGLFESGPAGGDSCEAEGGDVIHIPRHLIHRESNPGSVEQVAFLVRVGSGEPVINVDGPDR